MTQLPKTLPSALRLTLRLTSRWITPAVLLALFCAAVNAQVAVNLDPNFPVNAGPEATCTAVKIRNDSNQRLEAFAISVTYTTNAPEDDRPVRVFVDAAGVDPVVASFTPRTRQTEPLGSLDPNQETGICASWAVTRRPERSDPVFGKPVAAEFSPMEVPREMPNCSRGC